MEFFSIVTDTAGAKIYDLANELRDYIEPRINDKYSYVGFRTGYAIRCLPETHRYKSFTRYAKNDNFLTIDVYLCLEEYEKMYKAEQRFNLGKIFIEHLKKAFEKRKFQEFSSNEFIEYVIKLGLEMNPRWFNEEMDWTSDLDI